MAAPARDLIVNLVGRTNQLMGPLQGASAKMTQIGSTLSKTLTPAAAALGVGMAMAGREFNGGVDALRVGTGATGAELKKMTAQMKSVSTNSSLARIGLGRVGEIMADVSTRTGQTGEGLENLTTRFAQLERMNIAADVGNVARVFGDWSIATEDQAEVMDQLFIAAQESGASIDELSTKIVEFGAPLRNLGFGFEEATALLAAFEKNGVNTETVMAGLKIGIGTLAKAGEPVPETFRRIVTEIENTEDASEATRLAIQLFGSRAGPDLADAIGNGQFAIEEMITALATGEDTIDAAAEATTRWTDKLAGLKNRVVGTLGPFGEMGALLSGAVASIGPLLLGLGLLGPALLKVKAAVVGMSLSMAAVPWVALAAGVAVASVALWKFTRNSGNAEAIQRKAAAQTEEYRRKVDALASTLDAATQASSEQTAEFVASEIAAIGLSEAFAEAGLTGSTLVGALETIGAEQTTNRSGTQELLDEYGLWGTATFEQEELLHDLANALGIASIEAGLAEEITGDLAGTADEAAEKIDDLEDAYTDLVNAFLGGFNAQTEAEELLGDIVGAMDELEGKSTTDIRNELAQFVGDLASVQGKADEAGISVDEFLDPAKTGLADLINAAGLSADEVEVLIGTLQRIDGMRVAAGVDLETVIGVRRADLIGLNSGAGAPGAGINITIPVTVEMDGEVAGKAVVEANLNAGGGFQ